MASKKTAKKTPKKSAAPKGRAVKCKDVKAFVRAAKAGKLPLKLTAALPFANGTVTITAKGQTAPVLELTSITPEGLVKTLLGALGVKSFT